MFKREVKSRVKKATKNFPKEDLRRIANDIKSLKFDPLPPGAKKIKKGKEIYYRIRQGNFRIGYRFKATKRLVEIIYIKRRKESTYK